jgi:hypothetical protein
MKKSFIILLISGIVLSVIYICFIQKNSNNSNTNIIHGNNKKIETEIVSVNKLVIVAWGNMGTYIAFDDPLVENTEFIFEIDFARPGNEEWAKGGQNEHFVNEYIEMVNQKCNGNIKVLTYENDNSNFELKYEDGSSVIWDYKTKKGIIKGL